MKKIVDPPSKAAIASKKYRDKDPDKWRAYNRGWMRKKRATNPEWYLLVKARERAAKNGLDFTIEESDIVIPTHCPALGLLLQPNVGGKIMQPNSPTLDRIDSNLGYTKDNIQVISAQANTMKSNATKEELRRFAQWLLKRSG